MMLKYSSFKSRDRVEVFIASAGKWIAAIFFRRRFLGTHNGLRFYNYSVRFEPEVLRLHGFAEEKAAAVWTFAPSEVRRPARDPVELRRLATIERLKKKRAPKKAKPLRAHDLKGKI